jgi:excisionase family DNA binding protein
MASQKRKATPSHGRENAGNDGEWLTVREMREYMRVGKTKAYELIKNGEVGTYRLGRKILVSRSSIDGYIRVNGSAGRLGTEGNRGR